MVSRIAVVTGRTVFDLIRERTGARMGLVTVIASYLVNALAVIAELCGVATAIELLADIHYLLWVPPVAFLAWLVVWRLPFAYMERLYGLLGLALFVFVAAVWWFGPDWGQCGTTPPIRSCRAARGMRPTSSTPSSCSARR